MANRSLRSPIQTAEVGLVIVPGVITIQSGGVPISDSVTFMSASRSAVGTILCTFEDHYVSDKGMFLQLYNTGSQNLRCTMSASNVGAGTATFFIQSGSSNVDPSNQVSVAFLAMLKNSRV